MSSLACRSGACGSLMVGCQAFCASGAGARKSTSSKINTPDDASAELHASDNYHACLSERRFCVPIVGLKAKASNIVAAGRVRSTRSVRVTRTQSFLDSPGQALSSCLFSAWLLLGKIYSGL